MAKLEFLTYIIIGIVLFVSGFVVADIAKVVRLDFIIQAFCEYGNSFCEIMILFVISGRIL